MADTISGFCADEECSDCGKKGIIFKHWGSLVRPGDVGKFCGECWTIRNEGIKFGINAEPLGYRKSLAEQVVPAKAQD